MVIQQTLTSEQLLAKLDTAMADWDVLNTSKGGNEAVAYMMSMSGKRFRPLLVLQACDLFNADIDLALKPALGIEVFHNFTLVHDDIMDEADLRRGKPTVHIVYGTNDAIIAGDMLLCHAYSLMAESPKEALKNVLDVFSTAALAVMEGQQADMDFENRAEVGEDEYLKMIEQKTSVLLAAACQMGGIIGGATEKDAELLYEFGRNLGLMFQIKDDLLDAFGTHERVGKRVGGDIIQNKKTYLYISAMNLADNATRGELLEAYSLEDEDRKVKEVQTLFEAIGARKQAESKMQEYHVQAMNALNGVGVADDRKEALRELATSIYQRQY